ncbi:type I phosphoribosyltransferase [Streptomyces caniscabiei]|uniref:Adenine phosphoribosyltransferase n=1 Tax=Streptomyces caniscabiei TaxID=2746961 RepID=A0A927L209_9ACTN|nr:hypothetical protein [Streptomyces caniscabiei]
MTKAARDLALEHFARIGGPTDVWAIFRDAEALKVVVQALVEPFRDADVTAVYGLQARGFLLGAAAAVELGVGFVPVRKGEGLSPGEKVELGQGRIIGINDTAFGFSGLRRVPECRGRAGSGVAGVQ